MTLAKVYQTLRSLEPLQQWWFEVLKGDRLEGLLEDEVLKEGVYADHTDWCTARKKRSEENSMFWKELRALSGQQIGETQSRKNDRKRCIHIDDVNACREAFAEAMGCHWVDLVDG